jgi:hypothetical protein
VKKAEYGTFDKFDAVPPSYLGDPEAFKARVANNNLETIIIIPGSDKTVQLLHNCTVDEDASKLNGIFGTKQLSPLKQVAIGTLVKPIVAHAQTRSDTTPTLPSAAEFMECSSGADLINLVGAGGDDDLEKLPQSFWVHPHLLDAYVIQCQTKIESIGDAFVLAIEGMDDDSATKLTDQYYRFLVFVWAVANGHARAPIKLAGPLDDDKTDLLMEAAQAKFRKGDGQAPSDADNAGGGQDDDTPDGDGNRRKSSDRRSPSSRRSRSPRRQDDRWDERRLRAKGKRSRFRSRSRSEERRGSGARSRSRSPQTRGRGRGRTQRSRSRSRSASEGRGDRNNDGDILRQLTRGVTERQPPKGPSGKVCPRQALRGTKGPVHSAGGEGLVRH